MYDLPMCYLCEKKNNCEVGAIKKTCTNFFIKPGEDGVISMKKLRYGNSYRVMIKHVRKVASEKYGVDNLNNMIISREDKRLILRAKRLDVQDLRYYRLQYMYEARVRYLDNIHDDFKSTRNITDHAERLNLLGFIYEDLLYLKLKTRTNVEECISKFVDLAKMLTFALKKKIIDSNFEVTIPYVDHVNLFHIFTRHIHSGVHYMESLGEIILAIVEYTQKCENYMFLERTSPSTITKIYREELSKICSLEDDIEFDENTFSNYIESGIGNPVVLSRNRRKDVFLNKYGFSLIIDDLIFSGVDITIATNVARKESLIRSRGYPVMSYRAQIMLPKLPITMSSMFV